MSANSTTAMHGQSSQVGPLGAAAVLTAVVAFGALGFVIGQRVDTTAAEAPAAGPVIDSTSMAGPRTGVQKGLGNAAAAYSGSAFAAQYEQWLKAQSAAAGSDFPDLYQRYVAMKGAAYGGSDFAGQYEQWLAAQAAAAATDFPDYHQRHSAAPTSGNGDSGRDLRFAQ